MKSILACFLFTICGYQLSAQTKAHLLSRYAIIDPAYNASRRFPKPETINGAPWLYGYSELESWKLQLLRAADKTARLKVGYPGTYHKVYNAASFRLTNKRQYIKKLVFYACGDVNVTADGKLIYRSALKESRHIIVFRKRSLIRQLEVNILTNGEPACLLIKHGPFNTNLKMWEWKAGNEQWQHAFAYPQLKSGKPPHQSELLQLPVGPVLVKDGIYDFGKDIFGYVDITSDTRPEIGVGESVAEASDTSKQIQEQTTELIPLSAGNWRSKVPLAFRYVKVFSGTNAKINSRALFQSEQYKGAFACSDSLLTKIWMNSAYTLRLCMNDFLIDGIKRDRLPWAGDLAMSMQANAFSFADQELVRRSLVVLGRAGIKQSDINGIIDYSLWWIISQNLYQLYFADMPHLKREWPRIKEALNVLNSKCDSLGYINPKGSWLFIDWVDGDKNTALQVLWWWAQKSGSELAERMGDYSTVQLWNNRSIALKKQLLKNAWSRSTGAWMNDPYHPDTISRHANILAVIAGMADSSQYMQIKKTLERRDVPAVGTPYMAGFENMALSRLGAGQQLIDNVKIYWGGMLKHDATTFWEAYDAGQDEKTMLTFYDRPYGKSLCHAWSAGPAAFLPSEILGIKPLQDGWSVFSLNPHLGGIKWVNATIPTPHGNILVEVKNSRFTIQVPKGTAAKWGNKLIYGPQKITGETIH